MSILSCCGRTGSLENFPRFTFKKRGSAGKAHFLNFMDVPSAYDFYH